ncbi:MAG: hypothetical protein ACK462_02595 [Planctomyces sp.]
MRAAAPTRSRTRPSDALDVDTTSLTFDQVVAHLAGLVRERVGAAARMRP